MDLTAGKGRKVKQISKKKIKEEEPKGSFEARGLPVPGSAVVVSAAGGPLVLSLAGELSLAGDFSLAGELFLAGGLSLGISGAASGRSWWGCSAPTQTNSQMSANKEYPCAPNSGK